MNDIPTKPVLIVGGGWAGLSAAVELARHNIPVTIVESAKQLGGRARRVPFLQNKHSQHNSGILSQLPNGDNTTISVDSGQHFITGAYESTLNMLKTVGINLEDVFNRSSFSLSVQNNNITKPNVRLHTKALPAPLHIFYSLIRANGLSLAERYNAIRFFHYLVKHDFTLAQDQDCTSLFIKHKQSRQLVEMVWQPLCLCALNTPIETASAEIFLRNLRETFSYANSDSHLLLPQRDLSTLFPDPAMDFIDRHGGNIKLGQRVKSLEFNNQRIKGVCLKEGNIKTRHVILATPYFTTQQLIGQDEALSPLHTQLNQLESNSIDTVYLRYSKPIQITNKLTATNGHTAQWYISKRYSDQPNMLSAIVHSSCKNQTVGKDVLANKIIRESKELFPSLTNPRDYMVIQNKRATLNCQVNVNKFRPSNKTKIKGLWLAGDYTDTGLPGTLESAVRSGLRSARGIISEINNEFA